MSSSWGLATVTKVEEIKTKTASGLMVQHRYDEVDYDTQDIFLEDGSISGLCLNERRNRSGMPPEYVYCTGKSINWGYYPEDITTQKNIVNAFVINFKEFQREVSDGKLMETQTANYFSDIYPIDCAVLSANA